MSDLQMEHFATSISPLKRLKAMLSENQGEETEVKVGNDLILWSARLSCTEPPSLLCLY